MTDQLIKTMHLYKDEHIKDGGVHSQRVMQRWDGVPMVEHLLCLGIASDILHLSQHFVHRSGLDKVFLLLLSSWEYQKPLLKENTKNNNM